MKSTKPTTHFKKMSMHLKPREKALILGINELSDVELLAIIIRSGSKHKNVLEVAYTVLKKATSLPLLNGVDLEELMSIKGIGLVKALELKSLFEFARRFNLKQPPRINTFQDAINYVQFHFINWTKEIFVVLIVNQNKEVIKSWPIYQSHREGMTVDPREIIAFVLKSNHLNFYCFHNHPSGDVNPSLADQVTTARLKNLATIFGLNLLGHFILAPNGSYQIIL